jgi:hypothetical protein
MTSTILMFLTGILIGAAGFIAFRRLTRLDLVLPPLSRFTTEDVALVKSVREDREVQMLEEWMALSSAIEMPEPGDPFDSDPLWGEWSDD